MFQIKIPLLNASGNIWRKKYKPGNNLEIISFSVESL
jgi:hypothetical protein